MKTLDMIVIGAVAYLLLTRRQQAPATPPRASTSTSEASSVVSDLLGLANQVLRALPPSTFGTSDGSGSAPQPVNPSSTYDTSADASSDGSIYV